MGNVPQFDFRQIPFIRLLFPFVLGIEMLSVFSNQSIILIGCVLLILIALTTIHYIAIFNKFSLVSDAILIFAVLCLCGMLSYYTANRHAVLPEEKATYKAIIYRQPSQLHKYNAIDCKTYSYALNNRMIKVRENIRIYYKADSLDPTFQIGDTLIFKARVDKFKNSGNPGEFDFAKYMFVDGVYYMVFLCEKDIQPGGDSHKYPVKRLAADIQQTVIHKFQEYSIQGDELAVISALVVGNTERLDKEIRKIYSASGSMHILAVSGWHIGILFLFLNLLLGKRNQRFYFNLFRMVVILSGIWLYTFITGLSPSVMRSAVMFSLFLIGKGFRRQTNSFNILAASALIILAFDPNEIFMASFQLSYLAVMGILFFQPRLNRLLSFQNKITDNVWQLFTVSFAAQFITFPFCLYYFHQFPNYFWLTNLLIIPLVWIIMIITVLFFFTLPFITAAKTVAHALGLALKTMNLLTGTITSLPCSTIGNIRFELFHLCVCIVFILTTTFLLLMRRKKLILPCTAVVILILLIFEIVVYQNNDRKREMIIYKNEDGIAISLITGHRHLLIADSALISNFNDFYQSTVDFWRNREIVGSMTTINLDELGQDTSVNCKEIKIQHTEGEIIIDFLKKRICIPNRNSRHYFRTQKCIDSDYLIVNNSKVRINTDLFQRYKTKTIILESEVSGKARNSLIKLAMQNNIEIHDLYQSGALHIIY